MPEPMAEIVGPILLSWKGPNALDAATSPLALKLATSNGFFVCLLRE